MAAQRAGIIIAIVLLIIGLIVGYFAGQAAAPAAQTVTQTVTAPGAGAQVVTETVTQTITATQTVTAPAAGPQEIVIKVWASGSPVDVTRVDNVERAAEILNKMLAAAGVGVTVRVEKQFFRGDYMDKLTAAFAAGEAPDIIAMKNLPELVDGGYVVALDGYIDKYSTLLEDVYDVLWRAVKYKGQTWALPQDTEVRPLYFRKDVLRQLGWSEEQIEALPERIRRGEVTLADLIEVAKEAMDKGLVKWGFYHRPNFGGTPFVILYYQYGGVLQDEATGKLVLDRQAMLKMLQMLHRMAQVNKVLPPDMLVTE